MSISRLSVRAGVAGAGVVLILLTSCSGPGRKAPVMLKVPRRFYFSVGVPGWNDVRELVRKHAAAEEADTTAIPIQAGDIIVVEEQSRAVLRGDVASFRPEFVKYLQKNSCLETDFGKWYQEADGIVRELPAKGVYICGYDLRIMEAFEFFKGGRELTKHEGEVYILRDDEVIEAVMALIKADGTLNYRWSPVPEWARNAVVRKASESDTLSRAPSEDHDDRSGKGVSMLGSEQLEDRVRRSSEAWIEAWRALPDIFGGHYIYDSGSLSEDGNSLAGFACLRSSWCQDVTFDEVVMFDERWRRRYSTE